MIQACVGPANRFRANQNACTSRFFYGDLEDIRSDTQALDRWFNIDAGFERDPNKVPANFQKRAFPFRVDGVRGFSLLTTNMSLLRNIRIGGSKSSVSA